MTGLFAVLGEAAGVGLLLGLVFAVVVLTGWVGAVNLTPTAHAVACVAGGAMVEGALLVWTAWVAATWPATPVWVAPIALAVIGLVALVGYAGAYWHQLRHARHEAALGLNIRRRHDDA